MTDDIQAQIDLTRDEIVQHERQLALLRREIEEMERDLHEFQQRYDKIITPMQTRLSVIRAAIDDLRTQRRRDQGGGYQADWTRVAPGYVPVEEQYKRAWEKPPEVDPMADTRPNTATQPKPPLSADALKRLYRDLARRYHPDLAPDENERTRRTVIMSQINAAYTAGDADALQTIADHPDDAGGTPLLVLTLRGLQKQLEDVQTQVRIGKHTRDEMFYGAVMKLKLDDKLAHMKGRDLLMEMRVDMQREYDELLAQLDRLRAGGE